MYTVQYFDASGYMVKQRSYATIGEAERFRRAWAAIGHGYTSTLAFDAHAE